MSAGVEIQVCDAARSDAELKSLLDACSQDAEGISPPGLDGISKWRSLKDPLVLAVEDGVPVGICAVELPDGRGSASLRFLGIRGKARGQGVGTLLETHVSDLVKRHGYGDIRTGFSLDSRNEAGACFLDRQGWTRNVDAGLRMWRNLEDLPKVEVANGYTLRSFEPGDASAFVEIKNEAFSEEHGGGRDWTLFDFHKEYLDSPHFRPERVLFAASEEKLVGTTTAWTSEFEGREVGLIHWVAVVPEHRSKGLGQALNVQALHKLKEMGYEECVLSTNESLSSAVRLYLRLDFQVVTMRSTYTKVLGQCGGR